MELPLDLERIRAIGKVKPKYIDEETEDMRRWFIFGEYPDGKVDLSDNTGKDIFTHISRADAEAIMRARRAFCNEMIRIINQEPQQ